jgi:putative polyketide hydroxylase
MSVNLHRLRLRPGGAGVHRLRFPSRIEPNSTSPRVVRRRLEGVEERNRDAAEQDTQVLIVGGGLVGLASALFLRWHGIRCMLVERHATTSVHPRARGVNTRSMELFRSIGLEPAIRASESARALVNNSGICMARSLAGEFLGELRQAYADEPTVDPSPTGWCLCDQDELEPILRDAAVERGADIRFGTGLARYEQDADGVTAVLEDGGRVRADYLIAADGANSPIRTGLGIGMSGPGTLAHYMNIYFHADLSEALGDRRFILCYIAGTAVMGALLPVNNVDRWLLHVPFDPTGGGRELFDDDRCAELVRAAAGIPELKVNIVAALPWEAAGRTADRFADGRVFIAGDAAHLMPPTGAFGSNTGVQDAHNLAWKLAVVLRGDAGPELLDTYDAERRPVAAATVQQAVLRSKDRPRSVSAAPRKPVAGIRPDAEVMLGYRYGTDGGWDDGPLSDPDGRIKNGGSPQSCLVDGGVEGGWEQSGASGSRAPHVRLGHRGGEISTLDLFGPRFTLLCPAAVPGWAVAAWRTRRDLGVYRIGGSPGEGDVWDLAGTWQAAYGVGADDAVLVRPDGIVAWRSEGLAGSPGTALDQALKAI